MVNSTMSPINSTGIDSLMDLLLPVPHRSKRDIVNDAGTFIKRIVVSVGNKTSGDTPLSAPKILDVLKNIENLTNFTITVGPKEEEMSFLDQMKTKFLEMSIPDMIDSAKEQLYEYKIAVGVIVAVIILVIMITMYCKCKRRQHRY